MHMQVVRWVVATDIDTDPATEERLSCAPRATHGDGHVVQSSVGRVQQVRHRRTLCAFRLSRELTQERLASRAKVTKNYVSDLEGERRNPMVRVMSKLLDAMGITWEEFGTVFDRARRE
jgi:DNA-binding XRE family transcriptional regulator